MENKKKIDNYKKTPYQSHQNAALSNIASTLPDSNVPIPSLDAVIDAKEYVDNNQK